MKKLFFLPALLLLFAGTFTACDDDNPEEGPRAIQISPEDLTQQFDKQAESRFVAVTHSKLFDLKSSAPSWCNIKRTGNGLRITGINISVEENTLAASRSAEVTIWADDVDPVVIQVTQSAAPATLHVKEKAILVKSMLTFSLTVTANFEVDFELPEWITQNEGTPEEGTHSFTAGAIEDGAEPRAGNIVVKAKTLTGVAPVTIPVTQEPASDKKLPEPPTVPDAQFSAKWVDLYFTKDGYRNTPTNESTGADRVEVLTGAKTPASVWSDALHCYVASYPEATTDTYYAALYRNADKSINAEPKAIQGGFTMETYLKATNTQTGYVRPFANLDIYSHASLGFGFQTIDGSAQFTCVGETGGYKHIQYGAWDPNAYYHIVIVWSGKEDPSNNPMILYVNGQKIGESGNIGGWTTVTWDNIWAIGIGGNFDVQGGIRDGMTGEIAFFRWYADKLSEADITARYNALTARASSSGFADLKTMIATTLPAKAETGISGELKTAITAAIETGWNLMGNFETTDATVTAFLAYTQELLDYE